MFQKSWKKMILGLFILAFASALPAQYNNRLEGQYIDETGASAKGYFNFSNITSNQISFYPDRDFKNKIILRPQNVQQVEAAGATKIISYDFFQKDSLETIFLVTLAEGQAILYEGYSKMAGEVYFIKMPDREALVRVNRIGFQRQFNYLFGACSANPVGNPRYTKANLLSSFQKAQACLNPDKTLIIPENPFFQTKIGIFGRVLYGAFDEPIIEKSLLSNANLTLSQSIGFGIGMRVLFDERFFVDLGLEYTSKELSEDNALILANFGNDPRTQFYNFLYRSPLALNYSYLATSIIIRYNIPIQKTWDLSLGLGAVVNWVLTTDISEDYGAPFDFISLGTTLEPSGGGPVFNDLGFTKNTGNGSNAGFVAEFGVRKWLNERSSLELNARATIGHDSFMLLPDFVGGGPQNVLNDKIQIDMTRIRFNIAYSYLIN